MQAIEFENTIDLSVLPATAQQTLLDFYEFLVQKYAKTQAMNANAELLENSQNDFAHETALL